MKLKAYEHLKDEEVIAEILGKGQTQLYEILFRRYHHKVLDKCHMLLKNRSMAEDFAEDIFSKVFEKLSSFQNKSSFSSWLYSVTYNHCIDYLRNKKKLYYPEWNQDNSLPEIIDEQDEEMADINYDNLLTILESIHPEEKALLLMKYQDNLSLKVISQSLRISEDAAKMRLKRARARVFYLYKQKFLTGN